MEKWQKTGAAGAPAVFVTVFWAATAGYMAGVYWHVFQPFAALARLLGL